MSRPTSEKLKAEIREQVRKNSEPCQVTDLRFDLTSPCSDCPFKRTCKHTVSDAATAIRMLSGLEIGERAAFSCHKTDPRSSYFRPGYLGPVQHCAGAMIMIGNGSEVLTEARDQGRFDPTKLNRKNPDVFSIPEALAHFETVLRRSIRRRKTASRRRTKK